MPVLRFSITSAVAVALLAAAVAVAPAQAGPSEQLSAPHRPSPAGSGAVGLLASLGAIIEAELTAKEQKVQASTNPFLQPRPRPNREHIANSKIGKARDSSELRLARLSGN